MTGHGFLTLTIATLAWGTGCHAVAPFSATPWDGSIGGDSATQDTGGHTIPDAQPTMDTLLDAGGVVCTEKARVRQTAVCDQQNSVCEPWSDIDCDGLPSGILDPDPLCNNVVFIDDLTESPIITWTPPDAFAWSCGAIRPASHRPLISTIAPAKDLAVNPLVQVELTYEGLPTGDTGHLLSIDFHDGLGGARQRLCQVGRAGGSGETLLQGGVEPHAVRLDYDLTAEPLLLQAWITGEQLICAIGAVDGSRSASVINGLPGLTTGLLGLYVENATVWIDAIRIYELGVDD